MSGRFANLEFQEEPHVRPELEMQAAATVSAADHLRAALAEVQWARHEPALRLYTRALQSDRTLVAAWVGQVQMLVQLGEHREARVWSDKALELFRGNGELLAAKAQALGRLGDADGALEASDAALQSPGSSPWRWIARGDVLLARRRKYADECFRKAVGEPGADWFERVLIAGVYQHYQCLTQALLYLREALRLEPTHGHTWFLQGTCERGLGLEAAARVSFGRCIELAPDFRPAHQALDAAPGSRLAAWLRRWRGR